MQKFQFLGFRDADVAGFFGVLDEGTGELSVDEFASGGTPLLWSMSSYFRVCAHILAFELSALDDAKRYHSRV